MARQPISTGYMRASKKKQELSIPVQQEKITRYIEGRRHASEESMPPMSTKPFYQDPDTSGRNVPFNERPDGRRLLMQLQRGDHLVVARMDRLGRRTLNILQTIEMFERRGIVLHIIDFFGFELNGSNTPMGRFMINMVAAFAEFEGALISTRTKEALEELRRQGKRTNYTPPRGYKFDRNGYVVEDHEMQFWYKEMLMLRKKGKTFLEIAEYMNKIGAPAPRYSQGAWTKWSVGRSVRIEVAKEIAAGVPQPEIPKPEREKRPEKPIVRVDWPLELPPFIENYGREEAT